MWDDSCSHTFTVCTATFNRSRLLVRLGESLQRQNFTDFEWVVVDDGSTDNTRAVVEELKVSSGLNIRYLHQLNQGKHVAVNQAVTIARGKWFLMVDSDDWLLPGALSLLAVHCNLASTMRASGVVGVVGHSVDLSGTLIGTRFPKDVRISDPVEIYYRLGVEGDKLFVIATDVMREFPFPQFVGETFVSEGFLWAKIASKYKVLLLDEPLQGKEYLADGLTRRSRYRNLANPRGVMATAREVLLLGKRIPWGSRLWHCCTYGRFGLHARLPLAEILRSCPYKCGLVLTAAAALGLYLRDRVLLHLSRNWRKEPAATVAPADGDRA